MGKHLGDFGTPRPAHDERFGWLGQQFRVHPDLSDLPLFEFMQQAEQVDESDQKRAYELVVGQLRSIVHPDDFDRFLALSIAERQLYVDLMRLMKGLLEGLSDRPTGRRSDSPPGRRNTNLKSKRSSSSRVIKRLEGAGRPDLAVVVAQARDERRVG